MAGTMIDTIRVAAIKRDRASRTIRFLFSVSLFVWLFLISLLRFLFTVS